MRRSLRATAAVAAFGAVLVVLRSWALSPLGVTSGSMEPGVHPGDTVLVDRLSPRMTGWHRGDVVALHSPQDGRPMLKRIIGLPGDRVAIEDAVLVVNGARVREPYADNSHSDGLYFGPVTVPEGDYFMLGDSRSRSIDSRSFGPVRQDAVMGRMILRWSL
jgi:signal peptidase I